MEGAMMKKITLYIVLLLLMLNLAGCSKKYSTTNTYMNGQDFEYTYAKDTSFQTIAESEEGYYFLCGYYLYYADKATMNPVILCNKPNCLHVDETDPEKITYCNAAFPTGLRGTVSYFDGNVYVLEVVSDEPGSNTAKLNKLSNDGTKRKVVLKFEEYPLSLNIHRGKVYVASTVYKSDGTAVYGIKEYDLNKSASQKPTTIYEGELVGGSIQDLIIYGMNLYFTEFAFNSQIVTTRIMRYDIKTGKSSILFKENGDTFPGSFSFINDRILYSYSTIEKDTGKVNASQNFTCALDGTDVKESFNTENYERLSSDGTYVYSVDIEWSPFSKPKEEQSLKVTDQNGNVLASMKTANYSSVSSNLTGGSEEHLFLENKTDTVYQIYYANKNDFENGIIDFKMFLELDIEKLTPAIITKH